MSEGKKKSILSVVVYGAVLLIVAVSLIVMSLVINYKNTKRLEDEMDETQQGAAVTRSSLVNIQQENDQLKKMVDDAKAKQKEAEDALKENEELLEQSQAHIEALDHLATANMYSTKGKHSKAREELGLIDTEILTEEELEAYNTLYKRLH